MDLQSPCGSQDVEICTSRNNSSAALVAQPEPSQVITQCGIFSYFPRHLQACANVKLFTAFLCLLACSNGSISASYLPSIITAIERRFEFNSSTSGALVASYEIGATLTVIFVSYFGDRRHIPRILFIGTILVALGSFIFSAPHIISEPYSISIEQSNGTVDRGYCTNTTWTQSCEQVTAKQSSDLSNLYIAMFLLAQTLIGVGSTPILTLGLSYIDTHVMKKKTPQYLAFVYSSAAMGPVIGFGCGAALSELYVDFMNTQPDINPSDNQWVGAWWLGFMIFGLLSVIVAIPFAFFPKSLPDIPKESECGEGKFTIAEQQEEQVTEQTKLTLKGMLKSLLELFKNPVYMWANIGCVFEMVIVTGFITFVPKYLELQFDVTSSQANLYTGALAIPGAALGILSMGIIMNKLKLTLKGASLLTLILNILTLACFTLVFIFGCQNPQIAGITKPYVKSHDTTPQPVNLSSSCNDNCNCNNDVYKPVCSWETNLTYFSRCHAGCTTNQDCACLKRPFTTTALPSSSSPFDSTLPLYEGACKRSCHMLAPFMALTFFTSFFLAGQKTPLTMVAIRCVKQDLRSLSLGIQTVLIRVLALLPAPIIFGEAIDTTCLLWKYECTQRKNCLIYDVELFRYKYAGICAGLHIHGLVCFLFMFWFVKRDLRRADRERREKDIDETTPKLPIEMLDINPEVSTSSQTS